MPTKPDISQHRLMLITDRHRSRGRTNIDVITQAIAGGIQLFQLREPDMTREEFLNHTEQVLPLIRKSGGILILNDWVDVCIETGADGVHLGANDIPISDARRALGDDKLIGFSAHNREQALYAASNGADYITLSPAFPMKHKESPFPTLSKEELWSIADEIKIPTFFLGGITQENIITLKRKGSSLNFAIVSFITSSDDIKLSAASLLTAIDNP